MTLLVTAHILVCLILIRILSLDRHTALTVLMFGVLIDLDHLFGMADYVALDGWKNIFNMHHALASGVQWKSLMHQPVALIVVAPVAVLFVFAAPLLSWGLHLLMDYVQIYYLGIASIPEILLTLGLATILMYGDLSLYRQTSDDPVSSRGFIAWELARLRGEARHWVPYRKREPVTPSV